MHMESRPAWMVAQGIKLAVMSQGDFTHERINNCVESTLGI